MQSPSQPGPSTAEARPTIKRPACPHLGLAEDRTIMLIGPSQSHRCYAQPSPVCPDSDRQSNYCLTTGHVACPLYRDPQTVANAFALVPARQSRPTTQYPLVPVKPRRSANAQRVLLPMHTRRGRSRRPQGPRLLPAVSSYSAKRLHRWSFFSTKLTIVLTAFLVLAMLTTGLFARGQGTRTLDSSQIAGLAPLFGDSSPTPTKTPLQAAVVVHTPPPVEEESAPTAAPAAAVVLDRFITPTPVPGGEVYYLTPGSNSAGWWMNNDVRRNHLNDSFLYTGLLEGDTHIAALRFDLRRVPRGAELVYGELRLTGLRDQTLDPTVDAQWQVQLIAEDALPNLASADFLTLFSAPAAINLPPISTQQLAEGEVNVWELEEPVRRWIETQLLQGAQSITMRIQAATGNQETLFAWDSGLGPETVGTGPILLLSGGPAPATPPVLPTKPFVVATLTPVPENVLTVVAQNSTATAVAVTTGTYTPVPYQVLTPTPFPENLATVQAVALDRGLPPVLLLTPTPVNPAEATGQAQYATAVAVTTGTFTPVPDDFVTPALVIPSPPPENVATEAAQIAQATAFAQSGAATPTPLPYNAVVAVYVYATDVPQSAETAVAQSIIATAEAQVEGTPTALPWNAILITKVPTPMPTHSPTPTPLPSLQPITDFTPTPTPTYFAMPDTMPDIYRNKIVFKTNRSGREETFALDPNNGELFRVNEGWVHGLAYSKMALSPDGSKQAIVKEDSNRTLQIQIRDLTYGGDRQITTLKNISYDAAWSPAGDKIAFVSKDSGNDEIYTITTDGSILQKLTSRNASWDKHPSFSPDGTRIVFFSNRDTGRRQLWIMNVDGSNQQNLSNNQYEDWDPVWIP
ncbi:MAG: PD40 domain-containing protein [Caldilineaceae bacterium]|nr:PD40 domain-containing protein [Caldilineaceae bacterium]